MELEKKNEYCHNLESVINIFVLLFPLFSPFSVSQCVTIWK